jgi:hypothetical protein
MLAPFFLFFFFLLALFLLLLLLAEFGVLVACCLTCLAGEDASTVAWAV